MENYAAFLTIHNLRLIKTEINNAEIYRNEFEIDYLLKAGAVCDNCSF